MSSRRGEPIGLEEGWSEIKKAIQTLIDILENDMVERRKAFTPQEYSAIYTICYDMCVQRSPNNWSDKLYARHGETITEYDLMNRLVHPHIYVS